MRTYLNGDDWTLTGYMAETPAFNRAFGEKYNFIVGGCTPALRASVPGGVHSALLKAGIIRDPYILLQNLDCEWVENREWVYERQFDADVSAPHCDLVFEGINASAQIFLNGVFLGRTENPNISYSFDVKGILRQKDNRLQVVLEAVAREQGQISCGHTTHFMTQRYGYGWDFCTRLVCVGIFRGVYLESYCNISPRSLRIRVQMCGGEGEVSVQGSAEAETRLRVVLGKDGAERAETFSVAGEFCVKLVQPDPQLWYPVGYGEQPLYVLRAEDAVSGDLLFEGEVGFRSISYRKNEGAPADSAPYTLCVNGREVYLKGVCVLNFDQMTDRVTHEDIEFYLQRAKDCGFNLLRLWGGGLEEEEYFYSVCDRLGLLVWRDFFQSQSDYTGAASLDPYFLERLRESAESTVKLLNRHCCLAFYCGGNELKGENFTPVKADHPNIAMLAKIVEEQAPGVLFYPSCANGPNFNYKKNEGNCNHNHNIHGPWTFAENHFLYYNEGDWLYQGEFGVNGLSDIQTIRKVFCGEENFNYKDPENMLQLNRNIFWWNSYPRDRQYFSRLRTVQEQVFASQFMQAYGISYAIERNRARAMRCSGCNLWMLNEPYPNSDCASVIDFYKRSKAAAYFVRRANAKVHFALKAPDCRFAPSDSFEVTLQALCQNGYEGDCRMSVFCGGKEIVQKNYSVRAQGYCTDVAQERFVFEGEQTLLVLLQWEGGVNLYAFTSCKEGGFDCLAEGTEGARLTVCGGKVVAENCSEKLIPLLEFYSKSASPFFLEDNFFPLRAGEKRELTVLYGKAEDLAIKRR